MSYYLSLKLKGVKYSGDNIGRRFEFRLKIGDQTATLRCGLTQGSSRVFDKIVFQGTYREAAAITLPIAVHVEELDPVYNDFGTTSEKLKIRLKKGSVTKHVFEVKVEGRGGDKGKSATFTFVFEAKVDSAIRYVSDVWPNGWLKVKFDDGDVYPLPQLLKVEIIKIEKGREHFNVLEGKFRGRKASVGLKGDGTSYLLKESEHRGPARLILDQDAGKLTIVGLGTYNAIVEENPIPQGKYDLEIPDEPHDIGRYYMKYSKYAKTWFRISHEGDRFLHVGSGSLGCITVTDKTKWTEIYDFLIRSRKDSISVGEITVK